MVYAALKGEQKQWSKLTPSVKRGLIKKRDDLKEELGDRLGGLDLVVKVSDSQSDAYRSNKLLEEHAAENGGFVSAFLIRGMSVDGRFPTLTDSDIARLMYIGTFTGYKTGRLQHDNGHRIDRKELERLVGISRQKFSEFYRKLIDAEIIQVDGDDIYMNPSIFYRGSIDEIEYDLNGFRRVNLYRATVRELYENFGRGRTSKHLAMIYAVLPFLNFYTNIVCFNPDETDVEKLRPLNLDNLAALLHYKDAQKLRRTLESIKLDGKPVFYLPHSINDKRRRRVIINPRIVYAGPGSALEGIKVLFN